MTIKLTNSQRNRWAGKQVAKCFSHHREETNRFTQIFYEKPTDTLSAWASLFCNLHVLRWIIPRPSKMAETANPLIYLSIWPNDSPERELTGNIFINFESLISSLRQESTIYLSSASRLKVRFFCRFSPQSQNYYYTTTTAHTDPILIGVIEILGHVERYSVSSHRDPEIRVHEWMRIRGGSLSSLGMV